MNGMTEFDQRSFGVSETKVLVFLSVSKVSFFGQTCVDRFDFCFEPESERKIRVLVFVVGVIIVHVAQIRFCGTRARARVTSKIDSKEREGRESMEQDMRERSRVDFADFNLIRFIDGVSS